MQVLIVGGTGFIGKALREDLIRHNIDTWVLTRNASEAYHVNWCPEKKTCETNKLHHITHIINLAGAGIADKKWTKTRKVELLASRIMTTEFLYALASTNCPKLKGYVGISGVNAFGFNDEKIHQEDEPFGKDFLSKLVFSWENAHRAFDQLPIFSILRLGMVLSPRGGAYVKIAGPLKWGLGAVPGTGNQWVPWIHLNDVIHILRLALDTPLGLVHVTVENATMKELTLAIACKENKKIYLPNIPVFLLRLIFGEMSCLLTESLRVTNEKISHYYEIKHGRLSSI